MSTCDVMSTLTPFWVEDLATASLSLLSVSDVAFALVSCSWACGWQVTQHQMMSGTNTNRVTTPMLAATEPRMVARFEEQSSHSSARKNRQTHAHPQTHEMTISAHGQLQGILPAKRLICGQDGSQQKKKAVSTYKHQTCQNTIRVKEDINASGRTRESWTETRYHTN